MNKKKIRQASFSAIIASFTVLFFNYIAGLQLLELLYQIPMAIIIASALSLAFSSYINEGTFNFLNS